MKQETDTGITGQTVISPSCPVGRAAISPSRTEDLDESECAPIPVAARIVVFRSTGRRIATFGVASDGSFQVALPPGAYLLEAEAEGTLCSPIDITVPSHGYVEVKVSCDTGVR